MSGLDNPFHAALSSLHADIAHVAGAVRRYPPAFAPFLGVPVADADVDADLASAMAPGESTYLLGVVPRVPRGWSLESYRPLAQMVCDAPLPPVDGPAPMRLGDAHRADVLELTARVYPHYFRARTMDLGRYFGLYVDGRLAAMIGERLGDGGHRELSAICTDPDFVGRGYARRLTTWLANDVFASGRVPFLHVSHENGRAKSLYERLGFRLRRDIPFHALRRP